MLKEVGASGQISLGKKYARQLFDMVVQPDGSIVMQPVKVVPVTPSVQEERATYPVNAATAAAARSPAEQHALNERISRSDPMARRIHEWTNENVLSIEQYNAWAAQRQPYSQRVRQWREAK